MSPTGEVISRRRLSPHMDLPPCADRPPIHKTVLTFSKPCSYRGQNKKLQRLSQPQDHLANFGVSSTFHQPRTVPARRHRGMTRLRCSNTTRSNTRINGLVLSSCLKESWGASKRGLHHHSIIGHKQDFSHGRVPPAQ